MTKKALNDYRALLGKTVLLHGAYTSAYAFDFDPPKKFKVLETDKENIL